MNLIKNVKMLNYEQNVLAQLVAKRVFSKRIVVKHYRL